MKRIAIIIVAATTFILAGCGNDIPNDGGSGPSATKSGDSKGNISVFTVNVNGKPITCIESYKYIGDGPALGLSCDFGGSQ